MKKTEATPPTTPADLSTMLGTLGEDSFKVNDKIYTIAPLPLKDVDKFMKSNMSIGSQIFNLAKPETQKALEQWLSKCIDANGEPMTLQKAMDDDWNVVDLKKFFRQLCDLSG